jgi:hypothetical protein
MPQYLWNQDGLKPGSGRMKGSVPSANVRVGGALSAM